MEIGTFFYLTIRGIVIPMIYFLYGPDSYRRREKLSEIIAAYRAKHAHADIHILDCGDNPDGWREAKEFAAQPSMFAPSKVLVVRESGEIKEKEWIMFLKKNIASKDVFIFISDAAAPSKEFSFLLESPHVMQFEELSGKKLEAFVSLVAKKKGAAFSPEGLRAFAALLNDSDHRSWIAVSEIEKLALLGIPVISEEDVKKFTKISLKHVMHEEARKILRGRDVGERLAVFERLICAHESPSYLFNSLGFQASGIHAVTLAEYDVSVKSGALEYEEALLDFILSKDKKTG